MLQCNNLYGLSPYKLFNQKVLHFGSIYISIAQMARNYQQYAHTLMPYGRYRGWYLKDIPTDYIKWCVLNFQDKGMVEMMTIELCRREPKWR